MQPINKTILLSLAIVLVMSHALAQNKPTSADSTNANMFAQGPARSGITYNALTQFLQANVAVGSSGGYSIKSSLYTIRRAFSSDSLAFYARYLASKPQRNFEFALGLNKGSDGNYSLITAGIKYAIVNKRDISDYNVAAAQHRIIQTIIDTMVDSRAFADSAYKAAFGGDTAKMDTLKLAGILYQQTGNINVYPDKWIVFYKRALSAAGQDPDHIDRLLQDTYDRITKQIELRPLWIVSANPGYDADHSRFDTTSFRTEFVVGFGNYQKPWNVDVKADYVIAHDSTLKTHNLSRSLGTTSLGLNKVLIHDTKLNPILELQMDLEEDHVFSGLYQNERAWQLKLVSTLRVHLTKEISVPITLKYDLKHPNLWGIFNLQWNLQNSKKS